MKLFSTLAAVVAVGIIGSALVFAADSSDDPNLEGIKCPVSDADTKAGTGVEFEGGMVYFCCNNCPKTFAKDTAKFGDKARFQLTATGQATQEKCPISGGKIKADTALDVNGVEVTFCCNKCRGKVEAAEGDAKLALVFSADAFKKGFVVKKAEK